MVLESTLCSTFSPPKFTRYVLPPPSAAAQGVLPIGVVRESKKGGIKGEVKRGEVVGECPGPEGERGGESEGKRVGGKEPKAHSKTLISVPLFGVPQMGV